MLFSVMNPVFYGQTCKPKNIYERVIEIAEQGTFILQCDSKSKRLAYKLGVRSDNTHELSPAYFGLSRDYIAPDAYNEEPAQEKDKRIWLAIDRLCAAGFMLESEGVRGGFNIVLTDKHTTSAGRAALAELVA
ncbi:hypothetical protein R367_004551 [Salmonella enterica subsp. enterica serovar Braenderup]|nr:hypothetical protein [Salmonella enterica subsp. enterica serovar Braenderup]